MRKPVSLTVTLHPVPAGATLVAEGDMDDVLYRVEGGRLSVQRNGLPIAELGPGAVVGATSVLLRAPHPVTITGADKASFAKKYVVASIDEVLGAEESLFAAMAASLETEARRLKLRVIERELSGQKDATQRRARWNNLVEGMVAEICELARDIGGAAWAAEGGKTLARDVLVGATESAGLDALMAQRAMLRVTANCRRVSSIEDFGKRIAAESAILKERAQVVMELYGQL